MKLSQEKKDLDRPPSERIWCVLPEDFSYDCDLHLWTKDTWKSDRFICGDILSQRFDETEGVWYYSADGLWLLGDLEGELKWLKENIPQANIKLCQACHQHPNRDLLILHELEL